MKHSVLLLSMITALGLTACAEEPEEQVATTESEVLGNEPGGGVVFEQEAETSGGIVEREGEAGGILEEEREID